MKGPETVSAIEIKRAIVSMLESRPNNSCMYDSVAKLVLRELGLQNLRGRQRQDVERRIRKALGDLQRANVVKRYKSKNERIKLEGDHREGLARLERLANSKISETSRNAPSPQKKVIPDDEPNRKEVSDQRPSKPTDAERSIPKLPPLEQRRGKPYPGRELKNTVGRVIGFSSPSLGDGGETPLVGALRTMTGGVSLNPNIQDDPTASINTAEARDQSILSQSFSNALSLIDAELTNRYRTESSVTFDRLNVRILDERGSIAATVVADSVGLKYSVRCVLPLGRAASEEVLRITSDADFTSTPYLLHFCGEERIGIRRRVNVRKGDEAACAYDVLATIHDAIRVLTEVDPGLIGIDDEGA